MIRLIDLLKESQAPQGVLFLSRNKVLVGDNHYDSVELSKDLFDAILTIGLKYGYYGEGIGIEHNRGVMSSDIYKALKASGAVYNGSWDTKIEIPKSERYSYLATLFSNPTENHRVQTLLSKAKEGETIFNLLARTFDDYTEPGLGLTATDLKRFLEEISEKGVDFIQLSKQPATAENLQSFIDIGEELMWPSNWEEYPNKAGKMARRTANTQSCLYM